MIRKTISPLILILLMTACAGGPQRTAAEAISAGATSNPVLVSTAQADQYWRDAEATAERMWELVQHALDANEADRLSDETARLLMTAAVKLYARKADGEGRTFRPLKGDHDEIVTPTEALTATTEILRALRLGPMEFGLWSRRRPEDYYLEPDPAVATPSEQSASRSQKPAKERP